MTAAPDPRPAVPAGASGVLGALPAHLRHEAALAGVVARRTATLAVPGPAQAYVLAGLATLSGRGPLVVVTATASDAERLAADLACFLAPALGDRPGPGPVLALPAWETLPFERVSPEVATMGRRLAALWHLLGEGAERPAVVVAPVRALLQRLGPWREAAAPAGGDRPAPGSTPRPPWPRLVTAGYRREHQVEHRGEVAVRGGIIDVFPSTADPRCASTCGATRWTG